MPLPPNIEQALQNLGYCWQPATKRDRLQQVLDITPLGHILEVAQNRAFAEQFLLNPDISTAYIEKHNLLEKLESSCYWALTRSCNQEDSVKFFSGVPSSPLALRIITHFLGTTSSISERDFRAIVEPHKSSLDCGEIVAKCIYFNHPLTIQKLQLLAPTEEQLTSESAHLKGRATRPIQVAFASTNFLTCAALAAYAPNALKALTAKRRKQFPGIVQFQKLLPLRTNWTPEELRARVGDETIKDWRTWRKDFEQVQPEEFLAQFNIHEPLLQATLRPQAVETWPTDNPTKRDHTIEIDGKLKFIRLNPTTALLVTEGRYGADIASVNNPWHEKLSRHGYNIVAVYTPENITAQPTTTNDPEAKAIERTLTWALLTKFEIANSRFWSELYAIGERTDCQMVRSTLTTLARLASPIFEAFVAASPSPLEKVDLEGWRQCYKLLLAPTGYQIRAEILTLLL